jgi:salicylate hydroxylase
MTEPVVRLWFANEGHIVQYPVANGERINFALVFPEEREGTDGEEKTRDQLPAACAKWTEPLQELLAAAPSFRRFALYDRPPLLGWGKGHATLLGDAAHPMLPFMAQGAAAAIEDAVSLGRHLQNVEDIAPALRAYEAARASRTIKLQNASVENGRAHHANGVKRFVRDLLLPRLGGTQLVRRNDWIYRYGA